MNTENQTPNDVTLKEALFAQLYENIVVSSLPCVVLVS